MEQWLLLKINMINKINQKILKKVDIKRKINKEDYLKFLSTVDKNKLLKEANYLQGKKVVHINATAKGGGVAELLSSLIPYFESLGIKSEWYTISPDIGKKFFEITNKFFHLSQGASIKVSLEEWDRYKKDSLKIAQEIEKIDCDILVINDSQPLLANYLSANHQKNIYYNHTDTSSINKAFWNKIFPWLEDYQKIIFSHKDFVVDDKRLKGKIKVFTPAIDPLALKQKIVSQKKARLYLEKNGAISSSGPLIVQISRFDPWKNPTGLIDAFLKLQKKYKNAKLALVGFNQAKDNPAAKAVYEELKEITKHYKNIYLFFEPQGKNMTEFTMMAQNAGDILVQNSIREGFGLTVAEAMWKGKAVIGGPASGIRRQIKNGKNGLIAKDSKQLAKKMEIILSDKFLKKELGKEAKKSVLKNFLFPRLVLDHLSLYRQVLENKY
jgi:trehalose synthase